MGRLLLLDSLSRIILHRHLGPQEDLVQILVQQVHLETLPALEAVSLVLQNLPPQDSEQVHLVLQQEDSAQPLHLARTPTPTPEEDLDVRALNPPFSFWSRLTCVLAALTFGQQQNVTPVPVTGSQNPAYQVTSEKEQGQTYSTNFHAITMMPAYRNASFEVTISP